MRLFSDFEATLYSWLSDETKSRYVLLPGWLMKRLPLPPSYTTSAGCSCVMDGLDGLEGLEDCDELEESMSEGQKGFVAVVVLILSEWVIGNGTESKSHCVCMLVLSEWRIGNGTK